jgi:hypothetical protein
VDGAGPADDAAAPGGWPEPEPGAGSSRPPTASSGPPEGTSGGPEGTSGPARDQPAWDHRLRGGPAGPPHGLPGIPLNVNGLPGRPADRPRARQDRARGRQLGVALRRLMVTPTFAAGLGVVVAASLAVNMTKTVLHFSSPLPGGQCAGGTCHPAPPQGGTLASARPGVHIMSPRTPGAVPGRRRMGTGSAPGNHRPARPGHWNRPGSQTAITYELVQEWPGGFTDLITIGGLAGRRGAWSLSLSYPGARIAGVQGAAWGWRTADSGVAEGQNGPGRGQQWGGKPSGRTGTARFVVTVEGQSQPPSGCSLNGEPCSFSQAHGPN